MLDELATGAGLDAVIWLQENSNTLFDQIAVLLHHLGRTTFFMLILPMVYWALDKKLGVRMILALMISGVLAVAMKELLQQPRPFQIDPVQVDPLVEQDGYGFPSGHVATAITVWGVVALHLKRREAIAGLVIFVLLVGWSRMITGVHYPQDVIGGALVGTVALGFMLTTYDPINFTMHRMPVNSLIATVVLAGLVTFTYLYNDPDGIALAGLVWGGGFGLVVENRWLKFHTAATIQNKALCYALGVVMIGLTFGASSAVLSAADAAIQWDVVAYTLVAFVAAAGWPWVALRLGLLTRFDADHPAPPVDLWTGR